MEKGHIWDSVKNKRKITAALKRLKGKTFEDLALGTRKLQNNVVKVTGIGSDAEVTPYDPISGKLGKPHLEEYKSSKTAPLSNCQKRMKKRSPGYKVVRPGDFQTF